MAKRCSSSIALLDHRKLRENYGFNRPEVTRIKQELASQIAVLCEEWRKIHGR